MRDLLPLKLHEPDEGCIRYCIYYPEDQFNWKLEIKNKKQMAHFLFQNGYQCNKKI